MGLGVWAWFGAWGLARWWALFSCLGLVSGLDVYWVKVKGFGPN